MARSIVQPYFAGLSRNTFLLAFASLFADISTEMLYPVLPVFLTQTLRASGSIVGLVDGFAQATQNVVQGFSGALHCGSPVAPAYSTTIPMPCSRSSSAGSPPD